MTLCKCSAENTAVPALNEFFIQGAVVTPKEQRTVTAVRLENSCYQCILVLLVHKAICGSIPCENYNCNLIPNRLLVGRPISITYLYIKD